MMGFQMPENVIGELFAEDEQQLYLGYQSECLEIEMSLDEFDKYIICFRLSLKLSSGQWIEVAAFMMLVGSVRPS